MRADPAAREDAEGNTADPSDSNGQNGNDANSPSRDRTLPQQLTAFLRRAREGDVEAERCLMELVYDQLRTMARGHVRRVDRRQSLDSVSLLHEAWVKLFRGMGVEWNDRNHFFAVAARAMRSVLADHLRANGRVKRVPAGEEQPLDSIVVTFNDRALDLIALDEELSKLATIDPTLVKIVELRFFAGLGFPEIAQHLGLSLRTVERDWRAAKAMLRSSLA